MELLKSKINVKPGEPNWKVGEKIEDTVEDDNENTIINRLNIYHKLTEPIIKYYKGKNMLIEFSGLGNVDEITKSIIKNIENNI